MESTPVLATLSVSPSRLAAALAQVPDPRRAASVVYPLPAILAMAVAAILANHRSVLAIAEWGARQEGAMLAALGFPDGRTPCQSTRQRLFRHLDGDALSATLSACFAPSAALPRADPAAQGVAIDGKAQRGRLPLCRARWPRRACVECLLPRAEDRARPRADRHRSGQGRGGTDGRPGVAGAPRLAGPRADG
jgi:hypothetical protein